MIIEAIAGGYLLGEFVYHRWIESHQPPVNPGQTITVPTAQEGNSIPLIYGRVLVKSPIFAYVGRPMFNSGATFGSPAQYNYGIDIHFAVGIFPDGGSANMGSIATPLWVGGKPLLGFGAGTPGSPMVINSSVSSTTDNGYIGDGMEVMPGDAMQDPVGGGWTLANRMIAAGVPSGHIPGYRGMLSAFLFNQNSSYSWQIGSSPQPGDYAFECNALPPLVVGPGGARFGHGMIGLDLNPVDVIIDLLCGGLGRGGLSIARLDAASFDAAGATLSDEAHGFSRSWEDSSTIKDRINQVLTQIDGVLRKDPKTGLISIKLIRPDYDPGTIPEITPANCEELQNFAFGGWQGMPSDLYVNFTDRANNYGTGSGRAQNQANAISDDGENVQVTLSHPGICVEATANDVADREMQARSRPLMKCRVIVNRSFLRVLPGDAVKLTWPDANIAGFIFRVAAVGRGTLENGAIALDLLQDYFYTHRNLPPDVLGGTVIGGEIVHFGG